MLEIRQQFRFFVMTLFKALALIVVTHSSIVNVQAGFSAPIPDIDLNVPLPDLNGRIPPLHLDTVAKYRPEQFGTSKREKQRWTKGLLSLCAVPRWGIDQTWGVGERPNYGKVGFDRQKLHPRCWYNWVYRTGLIFNLSYLPTNVSIDNAALRFREVDITERNSLIRKNGDPCLSAIKTVAMMTKTGLDNWEPEIVDRFIETKPITVNLPNETGSIRNVDITRFVQHVFANRELFDNKLGLSMSGHRKKLSKPKSDRTCFSSIFNPEIEIDYSIPE